MGERFVCPYKSVEQKVVETDKAVYVDGKEIKYVLNDSVKTEKVGDLTIVTLSLIASEFLKR